jgi:hypothetical protein
VSLINTLLGMAVDIRTRHKLLVMAHSVVHYRSLAGWWPKARVRILMSCNVRIWPG